MDPLLIIFWGLWFVYFFEVLHHFLAIFGDQKYLYIGYQFLYLFISYFYQIFLNKHANKKW